MLSPLFSSNALPRFRRMVRMNSSGLLPVICTSFLYRPLRLRPKRLLKSSTEKSALSISCSMICTAFPMSSSSMVLTVISAGDTSITWNLR